MPHLRVLEASPWGSHAAAGPALPPFSWGTRTTSSLLCGAGTLRVWGAAMGLLLSEQQERSVGETQGGEAPRAPPHWEHPVCTGLSLGTLLLSSVVELGVRVQHPTWQVLQYSLKGGVGPQGHMIQERQSLR